MTAKEFRLGNWISIMPHGSDPFQLDEDRMEILYAARNYEDFYGIPLTPEILEKCGFENDNGEYTHPDNTDFDLMFSCSGNGLWCAYNYGGEFHGPFHERKPHGIVANPICNPFKYLHQLQNLYFALTGTELTVNL